MAVICRSIGLLFIMAPRTGCSAVGRALREQLDGAWLPEQDVRDARGRIVVPRKHCTLKQLRRHGLLSCEEELALLKVATVRNPFDSLVLLYEKRARFPDHKLKDPSNWIQRQPRAQAQVYCCRSHSFDRWIRKYYLTAAVLAALRLQKGSMFDEFAQGVDEVMHFSRLRADFRRYGFEF